MEKPPFYEQSHSKFLDDNRTITCLGKRAPEDDWEERAFAEDAAGGGCVWPPRSYFCSFCKREFRSAQALGGHMNVHRRDRAKLKNNTFSPTNENKGFCLDFRNPNSQLKVTMANNCSNELLCRVEDHLFSSNNPKKFENKVDAFHLKDDDEDETICRKRRRLTNEDEDEDEHQKVEVNGINSCSIIRELDLELRLGDGPKTCKNTLSSLLT